MNKQVFSILNGTVYQKGRKTLKIIDAHCDALWKMVEDESIHFYKNESPLHVHFENMKKSNIVLQAFALFVPPSIPVSQRFEYALKMIDVFYERVLKERVLIPIYSAEDVNLVLSPASEFKGAMLTLEGADALQGSLVHLRILHRLGVRALGFTWNHRNEAADGVEEPHAGGLSQFGRQLLKEANRLKIILDISHLAEKGFWDVMDLSDSPIIASHSNCLSIHPHRRNLSDSQIQSIIKKRGVIGLTFVPDFITDKKEVTIDDLLKHLEHLLSLGAENHIGFGSDFDGISRTMVNLQNTGEYQNLVEALLRYYREDQVRKWLGGNWTRLFLDIFG